MNELTNLEINTEIALIKDLRPKVVSAELITSTGLFDLFDLSPTHRANKLAKYFLALMFEFQVSICYYGSFAYIESDYTGREHKAQNSFNDSCMLSFRRSVLLCIIESHKDA